VNKFGQTVLTKNGVADSCEVLKDKMLVLIYFSAHWCPPCRMFTPTLKQFYENYKKVSGGKDQIEIVYASSDQNENQFQEYYGSMPWVAMKFVDRQLKDRLSKEYKINGIPSLVVINGADGMLVKNSGRMDVDPSKAQIIVQDWARVANQRTAQASVSHMNSERAAQPSVSNLNGQTMSQKDNGVVQATSNPGTASNGISREQQLQQQGVVEVQCCLVM